MNIRNGADFVRSDGGGCKLPIGLVRSVNSKWLMKSEHSEFGDDLYDDDHNDDLCFSGIISELKIFSNH